jgi:hypothetical protein
MDDFAITKGILAFGIWMLLGMWLLGGSVAEGFILEDNVLIFTLCYLGFALWGAIGLLGFLIYTEHKESKRSFWEI